MARVRNLTSRSCEGKRKGETSFGLRVLRNYGRTIGNDVCLDLGNAQGRTSSIVLTRASSAPTALRCIARAHWSIASLSFVAMASSDSSAAIRVRAALPFATKTWHRSRSASAAGL